MRFASCARFEAARSACVAAAAIARRRVAIACAAVPLSLVALGSLGCASAGSPCQRPIDAASDARLPAGAARIVFVRPRTRCDHGGWVRVVRDDGAFLGDLAPGTRLEAIVPAGVHTLRAWDPHGELRSDKYPNLMFTGVAEGEVAAGRTYYVRVATREARALERRFTCARFPAIQLAPVRPADADEVRALIAATTPVDRDPRCADVAADDVALHLREGDALWAMLPAGPRAQRTIAADDGWP